MTDVEAVDVDTPFGKPSDSIVLGNLYGVPVAFLPRHGRGHLISPTDLPVRANIYALKKLGVERLISVSAVGSLKEICGHWIWWCPTSLSTAPTAGQALSSRVA